MPRGKLTASAISRHGVCFEVSEPAGGRNATSSNVLVPNYAPLRFLVLWAAALMVAAAVVSSSAHAVSLGNATPHSTLGQPLRVTIPLHAAAGEILASDCFSLARPTADGPAIVTAKVSLERAAAVPRLVVTTREAVNEPAISLAVQVGCGGATRRDYVLLLDPSRAAITDEPSAAPAGQHALVARGSGQGAPVLAVLTAAARHDSPESSGTGTRRVAQRPVGLEASRALLAASDSRASLRSGLMQVAAAGDSVRGMTPLNRTAPSSSEPAADSWWSIVVAIGGLIAIILGAILVRQGRRQPLPEWSQSLSSTGPRSITDLSAMPVPLSSGPLITASAPTRGSSVTLPNLTNRSRTRGNPPATLRTLPKPTTASQRLDPSSDELLNDIEADLIELRNARVAQARRDKQDVGGNAILQAIEAAERDLLLDPQNPSDAAMERSLEEDLKIPNDGSKKAAA